MSYHAYLTTLDFLLNNKNFEIKEIKEEEIVLYYDGYEMPITLPKDEIQTERLSRAKEIMAVNGNILNRSYPTSDPDKCIAYLLLEDTLEDHIKMCWFDKEHQVCSLFQESIVKIKPTQDLETLLIAKLIREGYTLEENIGENVMVTSPRGVRIVCTPFECQCAKGNKKDCNHKKLVRYFIRYREYFDPLRPNG